MDSENMPHRSTSVENMSSHEVETESNNIDSREVVALFGDNTDDVESVADLLTKIELDLACSSEKLANLDMLYIHVASRENDFEEFASVEEQKMEGPAVTALEFDLLYGIFKSEVKEVECFLFVLQNEILSLQEILSSSEQLSYAFKEMEERFQNCEDSLQRCCEQVLNMKVHSANIMKILLAASGYEICEEDMELACLGNDDLSELNAKIKIQTAEKQRTILRMLDQSLAREMDLEKKLSESRNNEEDLKLRMQQLVWCMKVEAEDMWERMFEAENRADILLEISKELLGQNQMVQTSMIGSNQRIGELILRFQNLDDQLKENNAALKNSLEKNEKFSGKGAKAGKRVEIAESECKSLRGTNAELNKDMDLLNNNIIDASEKLKQLERLLMDSEFKRLHAVASAVASEEKQSMFEGTIKDMENLIKNIESKFLKAENQAESAEEKCIILSEANANLTEETNILRCRIQHLEKSLHQIDEAKKAAAKDIRVRSKLIANLVLQLAFERERLHEQVVNLISSLAKWKKIAVMYLQKMKDHLVTVSGSYLHKVREPLLADNDNTNGIRRSDGETMTSYETGIMRHDLSTDNIKTSNPNSTSNLNSMRNMDAMQIKFKYVLMAVAVLGLPVLTAYLLQL